MEEYHLSDGRVFVTGDRVEIMIHNDGHWTPGWVEQRRVGPDRVPVRVHPRELFEPPDATYPDARAQAIMDEVSKAVFDVPPELIREVS